MNFTSPLGPEVLLIRAFRGQEAISSPFRFELELLSHDSEIVFADLLRQPVSIGLRCDNLEWRYFHGRVASMSQGPRSADGLSSYRLEMVPWLSFLSLTADCRIYQKQSVQQIVTEVFQRHGFTDFEFRNLSRGQEQREYCVQYRETAFNFVSRLLEEEGIFYFFEHSADKHLLVLADSPVEHSPLEGYAEVFCHLSQGEAAELDSIQDLSMSESVRTGSVSRRDYFFGRPSDSLEVNQPFDPSFEEYDYPGRYEELSVGDGLARVRLEEHLWSMQRLSGQSNCRYFVSGHTFKLKGYQRVDVEEDQVLYSVSHEGRQSVARGHEMGGGGSTFRYQNTFTLFPKSVVFRPARLARKPIVAGTQTARVVGRHGEEITCDEFGRVKVQFHWDRLGAFDEESSCFIRVAQFWAGKAWGALFTPRIGQEVVVAFLEGDPDRPIIVGQVYNAEQVSPYSLPNEATKSTIKSCSSKGGKGFNELRFEDKKGAEQIFLHAQRNFDHRVRSCAMTSVGGNWNLTVGGESDGKKSGKIHVKVFTDHHQIIGGNSLEEVTGKASLKVSDDVVSDFAKNNKTTVAQESYLKGKTVIIEADTSISLAVGGNFVKIDASGVTIVGTQVKINSGGSPASSGLGGLSVDAPSAPAGADNASSGSPSNA